MIPHGTGHCTDPRVEARVAGPVAQELHRGSIPRIPRPAIDLILMSAPAARRVDPSIASTCIVASGVTNIAKGPSQYALRNNVMISINTRQSISLYRTISRMRSRLSTGTSLRAASS